MKLEYGLKNQIELSTVIKKSEFICYLIPVFSKEEAVSFINSIKSTHPNAAHNCSAYIIDALEYASDDGEPNQTAGMPMLNVLKMNNMNNICAVVTRYFGGIKLGAGGLVRAYSSAVVNALDSAEIFRLVDGKKTTFVLTHKDYAKVSYIINNSNINSYEEIFSDKIYITITINNVDYEEVVSKIKDYNYLIIQQNTTDVKVTALSS